MDEHVKKYAARTDALTLFMKDSLSQSYRKVLERLLYPFERERYWGPFSLEGLPTTLLYSANSDGEQIISLTSKSGGFNLKRSLSRATQGFVYIFGSSIVTVSSNVS
jgi:hypothetical protein